MIANCESYYTGLAPHYDALPLHRAEFVQVVARALVRALHLREADLVVDLGCGTGLFAREIVRQQPLRYQVVAADASQAMLDRLSAHGDGAVRTVSMDAATFLDFPIHYDKVFVKDAVAELGDASALFRRIRERLPIGGRFLVAETAPDSQTSLFKEARRRWEAMTTRPEELATLMERAGFRVALRSLSLAYRLSPGELFDMVYRRYVPVLATFDDGDLRAGVDEMRERIDGRPAIELVHRFDLVMGVGI